MRSHFQVMIFSVFVIAGCLQSNQLLWSKKKNAADGKTLATIDGSIITEAQVKIEAVGDLDALDLQKLKANAAFARNEQQILENAVSRLVEDKLLQMEATKRGISKEELLATEVKQNVQEPTSEEINAFYESNKQRIAKPKEEVTSQISRYLKLQKENDLREMLLKRLEEQHQVTRFLEPLRFNVDAAGRPSLGPASAPVTLVLFSDFQCPYCKSYSSTLKDILKEYGDNVRLVFRQFPLTNIHPYAQKAAEASLCAASQGRFWEMHDLLFQNQQNLKEEDFKARAGELGLDAAAFNACLDSARFATQVREDVRAGAGAGADGTPVLFINGRYLNGNYPYEELVPIIDEELKIIKAAKDNQAKHK